MLKGPVNVSSNSVVSQVGCHTCRERENGTKLLSYGERGQNRTVLFTRGRGGRRRALISVSLPIFRSDYNKANRFKWK